VPDEKTTKDARRDAAREAARIQREKAKKQERLRRWLIPTSVTVVVLAIATVVTLVIVNSAPAPQTDAGPKNMQSDGIVLVGEDGAMVPVKTPAIPAKGTPTPTEQDDSVTNIVMYVDFSCPACQAFEATNSTYIEGLVAAGEATLEVHPIAILDRAYQGTLYSTRSNNAGACVANYVPENFYDFMSAMYVNQPAETSTGLTNGEIVEVANQAGIDNADVAKCIEGVTFESWVGAATGRAQEGPLPNANIPNVSGTPTVIVNGIQYTGSITDPAAFQAFVEDPTAGA
jgi:protein-disulfide isomerase